MKYKFISSGCGSECCDMSTLEVYKDGILIEDMFGEICCYNDFLNEIRFFLQKENIYDTLDKKYPTLLDEYFCHWDLDRVEIEI